MISAPKIGFLPEGKTNQITDIGDITVGHITLSKGDIQTGVTVIYPHRQDLFLHKAPAAASVINGFGKSIGLLQLDELGVIETPIALSNTFAVPIIAQAQYKQAISKHPKIGREWATINPLVLECNDGFLNNIHAFAITEEDYFQACQNAQKHVEQGSVGAGRGMRSFGMKGGIGTASRAMSQHADETFLVGALVLSNFGKLSHLQINKQAIGATLSRLQAAKIHEEQDKGSIIMVIATNAPLDARQLRRLSMRAAAGLARTGSNYGHGSGDIAVAFSTAYTIGHDPSHTTTHPCLHETALDALFDAAAEATEQAIVNALWFATEVTGRDNHRCLPLQHYLKTLDVFSTL